MQSLEAEDVVLVAIGNQPFAFSTAHVSGVLQMMEPTPVPAWPDHALGLIDVHGELFPLVDPAPALGHNAAALSSRQYILVLNALDRRWGLVVDRVEGVRTAPIRPTESAPGKGIDARAPYVGLLIEEGMPVVVLDPAGLIRALRVQDLDACASEPR